MRMYVTQKQLDEKIAQRGPVYYGELEPAIAERGDGYLIVNTEHPAYIALRDKYAPVPTGLAKLAHGAVGIAKAVLHIDRAPDEIIGARRLICDGCEFNVGRLLQRCEKCGCHLDSKVLNAGERCPIGKWEAVTAR